MGLDSRENPDQSGNFNSFSQPSVPPPPPTITPYPKSEEGYRSFQAQSRNSDGSFITERPQYKMDPPPDGPKRNPWRVVVLVMLVIILLLGSLVAFLFTRLTSTGTSTTSKAAQQPGTTPVVTISPTPGVTPTQAPGSSPQAQPTVAAGTLNENITLSCGGCNDPIRVKITTIQIDPANGRMIWTLSLNDVSGNQITYGFNQFSLEANASQTQIPASFSQRNGTLVNNVPTDIQAIFAFVPYKNISYTLTTDIGTNIADITFDPVKITFQ